MGDHIGISISVDSPLDETLNRGPLALVLRRQYEFPFGINVVRFLIFNQNFICSLDKTYLFNYDWPASLNCRK